MTSDWSFLHSPLAMLLAAALLLVALGFALTRQRAARRARVALALEAARHAAVIESASEAVISIDSDLRIVLFNPAAERLLDCPRASALGQPIDRFIPTADRDGHAALVRAFANGPDGAVAMGRQREVRALRGDGREIAVEATVSKTDEPGSEGRRQLYTVLLRDLSPHHAAAEELRRISERYRAIVEQSPDAIWLAEGGLLRVANAACVALLGARAADELLGRPLADFLPPQSLKALPRGDGAAVPAPTEVFVRRLDGGTREVELSIAEVPDHGGGATQGVMHDITDRKRALAELHEAQAALLQAEQIARLGYATLDLDARRWSISPTLAGLLGLPAGTPLPYEESWHVVHPDDRAALNTHLERDVLGAGKPYDHEFRIIRASDGEVRWMHAVGHTEGDAGGRVTRLFATLQDVTERKLATLSLEHSREELRRLSASVTWAREAERRHVARELHDELGQRLSALKLDLATLLAHPSAQPGDTAVRMQHLVGSVDEAIAATRRIAADLRPSMLDDLGLNAALEWLADGWSRRTGMTITVDGDPVEDSLSEAGAITVYRIVQEALTNVTRHAQARHAHIGLRHHDAELVLVVEDDGRGLAPGDMDKRESSGLAGIRERARILGGRASIDNRPEGGCRLEVRVPFERVDSTRGVLEGIE